MYCPECGHPFPPAANFCPNCGTAANPDMFPAATLHSLFRPRSHRMIAGICAAFAVRYRWDLAATRIVAVLLAIFLFPATEIAYLAGWLLIPEQPLPLAPAREAPVGSVAADPGAPKF